MGANQLLILGVSGPELTAEEAALYGGLQPGGFVLSSRNLVDAAQTRKLTDGLRDLCTHCDHEPLLCLDNGDGRAGLAQLRHRPRRYCRRHTAFPTDFPP